MSKFFTSKSLKHKTLATSVTILMSMSSVANALVSLQTEQAPTRAKSFQVESVQLATMVCQGNWVNAGCTTQPDSGGQGSAPSGQSKPENDPCDKYSDSSGVAILHAACT